MKDACGCLDTAAAHHKFWTQVTLNRWIQDAQAHTTNAVAGNNVGNGDDDPCTNSYPFDQIEVMFSCIDIDSCPNAAVINAYSAHQERCS